MTSPVMLRTCRDAFARVEAARSTGARLGLVPTMGALHEGHLSLVRASQADCDETLVTIFVNPTQFGPKEDLTRYPRTLEADLGKLTALGVQAVFAPPADEIYPPGFSTFVDPPQVANVLEGERRPGHFRGVATVVLKLFQICPCQAAYFGQKDFQQALVIRRMAEDLNLPIEIHVCPIVREPDGLAMSSRNVYLDSDERRRALGLSRALARAARTWRSGERDVAAIESSMLQTLGDSGVTSIDYAVVRNAETLEPLGPPNSVRNEPAVALIAAHVGATRLIDNWRLHEPWPGDMATSAESPLAECNE